MLQIWEAGEADAEWYGHPSSLQKPPSLPGGWSHTPGTGLHFSGHPTFPEQPQHLTVDAASRTTEGNGMIYLNHKIHLAVDSRVSHTSLVACGL